MFLLDLFLVARGLLSRWPAFGALLFAAAVQAAPAAPIELDAREGSVALWPAVTALHDPTHTLALADVLARADAFSPPTTPVDNLGLVRDTVWLRVPVRVSPEHPGTRWWFTVDYVSLDEVDVYVQRGAQTLQHAALGDRLLVSERPFPGRTHTVGLDLPPGETVDLYVRLRSTSTMIVPMVMRQAATHAARENAFQLWHGLAVGIGLCVLIYALSGMLTTRQSLYGWLAWSVLAGTLYFFAYFGFAQVYLWPENRWLVQNGAAFLMLLVLAGGFMFAERSLDVTAMYPRVGRTMQALAVVLLVVAGLFVAGVVSYAGATAISTVFGPWPMLLSVTVAVKRARKGDLAATWTIVGWVIYTVGVVCAMGVNRGHAPAVLWMQEAHMVAALLNIFSWVMVINVRVAEFREAAAATQREHDRMLVISQTDPLTGLLNRRGLQLGLQPLIDQSAPGRLTAVYLLDLDGFKPVNDQHGHDAGDELLVQMGQRLKAAVRANDLVARLGGDEFVVVASQLGGETEAEVVGHKLLACCDAPFALTHTRCEVGMTVGYALAGPGQGDGAELLRRADSAMYGGKQAGKRRVRRGHVEPALT
jgi:diguanylate cyclase (GGDEF)-like protein